MILILNIYMKTIEMCTFPFPRCVSQLVVMGCSQHSLPPEAGLLPHLLASFPPSPHLLHLAARLSIAMVGTIEFFLLENKYFC